MIEDLTSIQRSRTPSKKCMQMEEISDSVPAPAKKRRVKQPAMVAAPPVTVKTRTMKQVAITEGPPAIALNNSGTRPKLKMLKKGGPATDMADK
jgi:hypothetical protein